MSWTDSQGTQCPYMALGLTEACIQGIVHSTHSTLHGWVLTHSEQTTETQELFYYRKRPFNGVEKVDGPGEYKKEGLLKWEQAYGKAALKGV